MIPNILENKLTLVRNTETAEGPIFAAVEIAYCLNVTKSCKDQFQKRKFSKCSSPWTLILVVHTVNSINTGTITAGKSPIFG